MDVPAESWLDGRIDVRPSAIDGLGLFARAPIAAGDVVMSLGGRIVGDREVRDRISRGERYDGIVLDDGVNLAIEPPDWLGIHGNHSCDPNVWLVSAVELAARRDIDEGDELVSDYATYTMAAGWSMRCRCGTPVCRGTISGDDWRRAELQRRYAGHFAPPIARRIDAVPPAG